MKEKAVLFSLFDSLSLYNLIWKKLNYEAGEIIIHEFPDEEILVQVKTPVKNKKVILLATIDRPNKKLASLIFVSETLRQLGAKDITLVAPYLPYMRQDKQFNYNEGITSKYFAKLISNYFDTLITIDPHLHRWRNLNDIYTLQTTLLHATQPIAKWIDKHIKDPVLIGPDKESSQWVAEIAANIKAPYLIVKKLRTSDDKVSATVPKLDLYPNHIPVLIDDIISTGETMIETIKHIQVYSYKIYCVGVHAIFAKNAYQKLLETGVEKIVTCNTIQHPTNEIDLSTIISQAVNALRHL